MPGTFPLSITAIVILVAFLYFVSTALRILNEYERGVIFRFGRLAKAIFNPGGEGNGPGIVLLFPVIDKMVRVSLKKEHQPRETGPQLRTDEDGGCPDHRRRTTTPELQTKVINPSGTP